MRVASTISIRDFNMKTAIILTALAVLSADQVYGRVKFGPLCGGSTSNTIRGCAKHGCGHFGASRAGGKTHNGVDIVCNDGDTVYAPFDMKIIRRIRPFGNGNAIDDGIEVNGPNKYSGDVKKGEVIGTMLKMQDVHPGIISHLHIKMCDNSDPTEYI